MLDWLNSHGFLLLFGYYVFISIAGTMPPLPPTATYFQRWAFGAVHALCGNMKSLMSAVQPKNGNGKPKEG